MEAVQGLIEQYGYAGVVIGTFFEGETVLLVAGFIAHLGYLRLDLVIVCAFIGSVTGDQAAYWIGRRYGRRLVARWPSLTPRLYRFTRLLERHQNLVLLSFRFIYGMRLSAPLAIALSEVSPTRFVLLNAAGGAAWAFLVGLLGYGFGQSVETLIGDIKRVEHVLLGAAGVALLFFVVHRLVRHFLIRRDRPQPPPDVD